MVNEYKKKLLKELKSLVSKYKNIGIVDINNLPARQFQDLREKLRALALVKVGKKTLFRILFRELKGQYKDIEKLNDFLKGMPALLLTNENPFRLARIINENKTDAFAKAGQVATRDIVVREGPTPFAPGPIISELGSFGIKTGVDKGKVTIKADKVVAKEGEVISPKLANLLSRLNIKPMEIGLNLVAMYENGIILTKDVLFVDEEEFLNRFKSAYSDALSLSIGISYPTKDNIDILIRKTQEETKALIIGKEIFVPEMVSDLIKIAQRVSEQLFVKVGN